MCDFLDFGLTFFLHYVYSGSCMILAFQKTLVLAFEANSALSCENETKIVKITYSDWPPKMKQAEA